MKYYQRMRDMREDHDLNQTELGVVLGTTQSYYAQYENGKREMPFTRAIELALFYNISLDYLAGLIDEPRPLKGT